MDKVLLEFFQALRHQGIRISTAETLDALHAVSHIGYRDRNQLRLALQCSLIKSHHDFANFNSCFNQYFSLPQHNAAPKKQPKAGLLRPKPLQPQSTLGQWLLAPNSNALEQRLAQAASQAQLRQMKIISQRGLYAQRMLNALGMAQLEQEFQSNRQGSGPQKTLAENLTQAKAELRQTIKSYIDRQFLLHTKGQHQQLREQLLLETRIDQLPSLQEARQLVKKLAKRLQAAHTRRRKVPLYGQLNVQQTLRKNMAHDGVILETCWRQKRIERPKVWVICDVSGSVRPYSGFLLLLLHCLTEVLSKVRSFAFSGDLVEVTQWFERLPLEQAIHKTLKEVGQGSTDYGTTFASFEKQHLMSLDRRATVIILGDARNNEGDANCSALQAIHQRAGRVYWLNPEDKRRWGSGDSEMLRYQAYCSQVVSCQTLNQLERFVGQLIRYNR